MAISADSLEAASADAAAALALAAGAAALALAAGAAALVLAAAALALVLAALALALAALALVLAALAEAELALVLAEAAELELLDEHPASTTRAPTNTAAAAMPTIFFMVELMYITFLLAFHVLQVYPESCGFASPSYLRVIEQLLRGAPS